MLFSRDIRKILSVSFVLVSTVPLLLIGFLSFRFFIGQYEHNVTERNFLITKALSAEVSRFLEEPDRVLRQIGAVVIERGIVSGRETSRYIETVKGQYPVFTMIALVDRQGSAISIAPFNPDTEGIDYSGHPSFIAARESGKPSWSSTFISSTTGTPTVTLTVPLENRILVGDIDLAVLNRISDQMKLGTGGYAVITDTEGTIIAHRQRKFVAERMNIRNLAMIRDGLTGKEGVYHFLLDGEMKLGTVARIGSTGWVVAVVQPLDEAFSGVVRVGYIFWAGISIAAFISVVAGLFFARRIADPITALAASAKEIEKGRYDSIPRITGFLETRDLSRSFAAMAEVISVRENALRASEEQYRILVENAGEAIYILKNGGIWFHNVAMQRLFGLSGDAIIARRLSDFIVPEDRHILEARLEKHSAGESVSETYTVRAVAKNGDILWLEINDVPIIWEKGSAVLNFARDMTRQKRLEEQFYHAQKMEAIGTLAGSITHDFNNLLTGIGGFADIMLIGIDEKHSHYSKLLRIRDLVESGAQMNRRLLGFVRGGSYEVKPTDLNDLIRKTAEMFGQTKKEATIRMNLRPRLRAASADPGQIEQVLLNLFVNAVHAMPGGGVITIETDDVAFNETDAREHGVPSGEYLKITVSDTGEGMDEATRKRVFEPFFTTKGKGRGTGLGLAAAYSIVTQHGGCIRVKSEKGKGSAFTIHLPVSPDRATEKHSDQDPVRTGTETILIVDDEPTVSMVMREMLETLGYRVICVRNGPDAIEIFTKDYMSIALVILDMIMPGMNGAAVFDRLKMIDPSVRVILCSGYSEKDLAGSVMSRGGRAFLQKPIQIGTLSRTIREVLTDTLSSGGGI